jgi:hypothetical protein
VQDAGASAGSGTHKRTLAISGDTIQTIQIVNSDNGGADVHATITISPVVNVMNDTLTCPANQFQGSTYTATPTTLAILKPGTTQVETYNKQ